jgi:hypothetical protein
MKKQKKAFVVFLIITLVILTCLGPIVIAEGETGNQNIYGPGNQGGHQQHNSSNSMNQMGGGTSQNGSGTQGGHNQNSSGGKQFRYQYRRGNTIMDEAKNYTRIRSQYRGNNTNEAFEIFFTIDHGPAFELSYFPTLNSSNGQHQFSLSIAQLIEYNDLNKNGLYDKTDSIVSSFNLSTVPFANMTYSNMTTNDGKIFTSVETHTLDNLFSITSYVVSEKISLFNTTVTQKEIKIDFTITDYPFVNQTSQLALITNVQTPFFVSAEQETPDEKQGLALQESGLNISSANHSGFFTWANEVTVDNETHPIQVTVVSETKQTFSEDNQETATQTQVIFSYPRGEIIVHDPKVGVIELASILPAVLQTEYLSLLYLFACLISGIVFYGIVYVRKKH